MPRFVDVSQTAKARTVLSGLADRAFYVSTNGHDSNDGSIDNPFLTIPYAVTQLEAGDTLYILAGTYDQPAGGAVFQTSGTPSRHITIQGIGAVIIECSDTNTYGGETVAANLSPAFDTDGNSYIDFKNFTVVNVRSAVKASTNSHHITLDKVDIDRCHFGVFIDGASHITVTNAVITDCRYGVRTDSIDSSGSVIPQELLFENIDVSGSKDIFNGWDSGSNSYNGDGFIFEYGDGITVRDSQCYDNWDAGMDIKADNVVVERCQFYGNDHQGVKTWGDGIVLRNCVIRDNDVSLTDPVSSDGIGINIRSGDTTLINSTITNNYAFEIKMGSDIAGTTPPNVTLRNCIIARDTYLTVGGVSSRCLLHISAAGSFTETNSVWYDPVRGNAGTINGVTYTVDSSSTFADPLFIDWDNSDLRLKSTSPAVGLSSSSYDYGTTDVNGSPRLVGSAADAGAYEANFPAVSRSVETISTPQTIGDADRTDYLVFADIDSGYDDGEAAGNTVTLLRCEGDDASTTITDSSILAANWTASGNAQIAIAQYKYGASSLLLDGSGDYIQPTAAAATFAYSGDFTIEMWIRPTTIAGATRIFYDGRPSGTEGAYPVLYLSSGGVLTYFTSSADRITGSTLSINTWYHVALCRASGTTKMFLDGVQDGGDYVDGASYLGTTLRPRIGANATSTDSNNFAGYIDDIRITNGTARYTTGFTPPAAELPDPAVLGLPTAVGNSNSYTVRNVSAIAVSVAPQSGEEIDGDTTAVVSVGASATFVSDGSDWFSL